MKMTIKFPVQNIVKIEPPWPIKNGGKTLWFEMDNDTIKQICITISNIPVSNAGTIIANNDADNLAVASINIGGSLYILEAERLVREWQTILISFALFEIDFDNPNILYDPEDNEEKKTINLHSFTSRNSPATFPKVEFEHIGRAFLAASYASDHLESVAHYRNAEVAQRAGRFIDAYNGFFLFLETRYCGGKTQTKEQVKRLLNTDIVVKEAESNAKEFSHRFKNKMTPLAEVLKKVPNIKKLINEIILLRGNLRHHSLNSPKRWDPNNQKKYEIEARFLGALCGSIILKELFMKTYEPEILEEFQKQAHKMNAITSISIINYLSNPKERFEFTITYPLLRANVNLSFSAACEALNKHLANGTINRVTHIQAVEKETKKCIFNMAVNDKFIPKSQTRQLTSEEQSNGYYVLIEYKDDDFCKRGSFNIPSLSQTINQKLAWEIGLKALHSFDHKTPTAELYSMKIYVNHSKEELFNFEIGHTIGR